MNIIMKINLSLKVMFFLALYGCKNYKPIPVFNTVQITPIIEDSLLNIRALELNSKELVAISSVADVYHFDLKSKSLMKNIPDDLNLVDKKKEILDKKRYE